MKKGREKLEDVLAKAQVLMTNALGDAEVREALAGYGYDAARLERGRVLLEEALDLWRLQKKQYGSQVAATVGLKRSKKEANAAYMRTLKVARRVLKDHPQAAASLLLYGDRQRTLGGWLEQVQAFYTNLAADPGLLEVMASWGYPPARLNADHALVDLVTRDLALRSQDLGEAQEATERRNKKLKELRAWLADYKAIARIALEASPQVLEKLGILVRG